MDSLYKDTDCTPTSKCKTMEYVASLPAKITPQISATRLQLPQPLNLLPKTQTFTACLLSIPTHAHSSCFTGELPELSRFKLASNTGNCTCHHCHFAKFVSLFKVACGTLWRLRFISSSQVADLQFFSLFAQLEVLEVKNIT